MLMSIMRARPWCYTHACEHNKLGRMGYKKDDVGILTVQYGCCLLGRTQLDLHVSCKREKEIIRWDQRRRDVGSWHWKGVSLGSHRVLLEVLVVGCLTMRVEVLGSP